MCRVALYRSRARRIRDEQNRLFEGHVHLGYERSATRYAAVRQSLGEPDPFRLQHRDAIRTVVRDVVRRAMGRKDAVARIVTYARDNVDATDHERFREVAENELLALHEGNFARYQIRPAEFEAWRRVWNRAIEH
jgi:hypothetical protein